MELKILKSVCCLLRIKRVYIWVPVHSTRYQKYYKSLEIAVVPPYRKMRSLGAKMSIRWEKFPSEKKKFQRKNFPAEKNPAEENGP
jgi:hypothetical protein